jgi:gas vesicle protein
MSGQTDTHRNFGFVIGLAAGTVVGAGLAIWLAPQAASEIRQRMADAARRLRGDAAERYRDASRRIGVAVDGVTSAGQDARDGLADAVVRGAQTVERYATAAKVTPAATAGPDGTAPRTATAAAVPEAR